MEVINSFQDKQKRILIFELKSNGVPKTNPISDRFQWFLVNNQIPSCLEKLDFIKMDKGYREFKQGKLTFNDQKGEYLDYQSGNHYQLNIITRNS